MRWGFFNIFWILAKVWGIIADELSRELEK